MKGLTLIELIVVLSIIALLSIVGIPSYYTYLMESRRSDAFSALHENQLIIEQYLATHGETPDTSPGNEQVTLVTTSAAGFYTLTYTQVGTTRYTLVATAAVGTSQEDDTGCTVLTLISEMDTIYPITCN